MLTSAKSGVRQVELSRPGYVCLVDEADYELVSQYKWYPRVNKRRNSDKVLVYACRGLMVGREWISQGMHRFLLNAPRGIQVDHINGNTLDNRRSNLRLCSNAQNVRNRGRLSTNKSGHQGVTSFQTRRGERWSATITANYKKYNLGAFDTKDQAIRAYRAAAQLLHGEFTHESIR